MLDEAKSSLVDRKGLPDDAAEAWVGHMRREFPNGRVDPARVADDLDVRSLTRDPKDVHVCALAIAGDAELLFTFDRGYLKEPLREHGIEVPDLDEFLVGQCREQPEVFARIVERQADAWSGGRPVAELLSALARANVPRLAEALAFLVEPVSE